MRLTRRDWLSIGVGGAVSAAFRSELATAQESSAPGRIRRLILAFEQQGFHRTGTEVDQRSGDWLSAEVRRVGLTPALESFAINRVDLIKNELIVGARRIEGIPVFDGSFTDADGVRGRLGALQSDAEIGLTEVAPNAAASGVLGEARRSNRHRAIVAVTRGTRPGLCPSNADFFLRPFGPPVLQVSSDEGAWLSEQAQRGAEVVLVAQVRRTAATAVNVTTMIEGTDRALPPLVVMTPRSGWYWCASERGGGIACWLEAMRALQGRSRRPVLFVASSGHELGHLGINAFVDRRPGIVQESAGWIHLGANIGAAMMPGNTVQASDDDFEAMLSYALTSFGLSIDTRIPRGTMPRGEAEVVHRGGGRYVSVIGRSALFHHLEDRGPHVIDASTIAKFSAAVTSVAGTIASS
jgi:hypothetical protein